MRTALVSVTDKTGLDGFLRRLERFDTLKLIATTSTAKFLSDSGFSCIKVEELTGFPEILAGRVKTLHPRVFAGILARSSHSDRSCLKELDISEIDLVIVNLYAFEDKAKENLAEQEMVEQIDVGGVALLRAAAKNYERVAVISSPGQYDQVIEILNANSGEFTLPSRRTLAYEAFQRTARYDQNIASYLERQLENITTIHHQEFPGTINIHLKKLESLRYGENPHQAAAWYRITKTDAPSSLISQSKPPFLQLQGKELSANNLTDSLSLVKILRDLNEPAACIIKHNNPCGIAISSNIVDAFDKAYNTDPLSAFGGVYGFNELVEKELAERIVQGFVEIVLAPQFSQTALAVFQQKKNLRVIQHDMVTSKEGLTQKWRFKDLEDFGWLVETDETKAVHPKQFQCVTKVRPEKHLFKDIAFAWSVVAHLTSNAIFVTKEGRSTGFGIGQTSRIASMKIALEQSGALATGAVLASDGFFPATDNIEAAARAKIAVIVQPGGSIKDKDVIEACDKARIAMLFTGQRCFKH